MRRELAALGAGVLFGAGLAVSEMVNPAKVLSFLDIFGQWDPSLALVMGAALIVTFFGYRLVLRRGRPLLAPRFELPTASDIDGRLVGGAVIFGLGWGLVGFCPGPAIAAVAFGAGKALIFLLAMAAGAALFHGPVQRLLTGAT